MRRVPAIALIAVLLLLILVLWFAERGWREIEESKTPPSPSPAPVDRETFTLRGTEPEPEGTATAPIAGQRNVVGPVPALPRPARPSPMRATPLRSDPVGVDERPLWDLLHQGRHQELRAAIAENKTRHPDGQPPAQLIELMERGDNDSAYQARINALASATAAEDQAKRLREANALAPMADERRDAAVARMLGWTYYDAQQDEEAVRWFSRAQEWSPSEEGAYGLALALRRQGDAAGAAEAARAYGDSPRIARLLQDFALERARKLHDAGDYAGSEHALAEAQKYGELDRGAQLLHAWNLAKLGRHDEAGKLFADLYRAQPDDASADGVMYSYEQAGDRAALARLSDELGGPLAERFRLNQARQAYARKQFIAARHNAPQAYPLLANVERPELTGGILWRQRSGTSGLSLLSLLKMPWLEGRFVTGGTNQWRVQIDDVHLNSGGLASDAVVGTASGTPNFARVDDDIDAGKEVRVSVAHQGPFAPYASIGTTPLDGPVEHRWLGQLGATWYGARAAGSLEWSARPVRDSMLSYVGMVDPYTGAAWGRVVAQGVSGRVYSPIAPDWDVFAQAQWAELRGKNVMTNERQGIDLSVNRVVQKPGYDRIAIGPYIGYERYAKNLSQFTIGHGGYFSPQFLLRTGVALEALTGERESAVMRARLALGYQTHRQNAMPYLPFTPDPPSGSNGNLSPPRMYAASKDNGAAINGEWYGVWRLAPRWQLGGGAAYRRSPAFEEIYAGAFIRYSFGDRPALFSSDLPPALFGAVE